MTLPDEYASKRKWAAFEKERTKLSKAFAKATTPKERLIALSKLTRQHGEWMDQNMLTRGWISETVIGISDRMEEIAESIR